MLHSLPRAGRGLNNDFMLCFHGLWNRITMNDMDPVLCSLTSPSSQWLTVLRRFKASMLCRNWPHSCRSWPGYVFFTPLISTHFSIPSFCWHVWAYLPPLCNISLEISSILGWVTHVCLVHSSESSNSPRNLFPGLQVARVVTWRACMISPKQTQTFSHWCCFCILYECW